MSPRLLFRLCAFAEMVTWAGLITALIVRAVSGTSFVSIAGGAHGFVFLTYGVTTVFVWVNERWPARTGVLGLLTAIVPFATVPFEWWVDRRGMLSLTWRLGPSGDAPSGIIESLQAWVLRRPLLALILIAVGVSSVFVVLLWLGPPVPRA